MLLALQLIATASPLNSTNASSGLRWTGEVPGHGLVTLYGTVDSVEQQLFALSPSLREDYVLANPYMSPTPRPFNETEMVVSNLSYSYKPAGSASIAGRADVDPGVNVDQGYGETHWYCGNFATGSCRWFSRARALRKLHPSRLSSWMIERSPIDREAPFPQEALLCYSWLTKLRVQTRRHLKPSPG